MINYDLIKKYVDGIEDKLINELLEEELTSFSNIFSEMFNEDDYEKVNVEIKPTKIDSNYVQFQLQNYDVIDNIRFNVSSYNKIKLEIGGSRIESYNDLIQQKICKSLNKNDILFFNTIPLYHLEYHNVVLYLIFNNFDENINDIKLIANGYNLTEKAKEKLPKNIIMEYLTIQNQYCEKNIRNGINNLDLYFCGPTFLLYFYGCDKDKIKNVKLLFDNEIYYNGSINNLNSDIDSIVSVITFSNEFDKNNLYLNNRVNLSKVDNIRLVIESEKNAIIKIGTLSYNSIISASGMLGLAC